MRYQTNTEGKQFKIIPFGYTYMQASCMGTTKHHEYWDDTV